MALLNPVTHDLTAHTSDFIRWRALKLSLVASVVAGLGIVLPYGWFLAPLGLALFFSALRDSQGRVRQVVSCSLLFGAITAAAGTVWFLQTLPLTFLGIETVWVQVTTVSMTWGYVVASLAAPVPLGALALWFFRRSLFFPLFASIVWSVIEIGRMWMFALTTYGPRSLFGPHFSAAAIGYSLTEHSVLRQLAYPWGLDALNFCAAFIAGLIAVIPDLRASKRARVVFVSQIIGVVAVWIACQPSRSGIAAHGVSGSLRFAIIAENLDSVFDDSAYDVVQEDLSAAMSAQPPVDVIVLPEELGLTSTFWSKEDYRLFVERYVGTRDVLIVNSRNELFPADERNEYAESKKLVYESTQNGELGRYIKQMLVPLGEYAPSATKTLFSVIPDPSLQGYINEVEVISHDYTRDLSVGNFRGVRLGGLLCSDLFSPYLYRRLVREHGAQVLINAANHFWFHGSRILHWKTRQIARVHAVQNRLPMLLANNMAPSLVLDSSGATVSETRWGDRGVVYADLPLGFIDRLRQLRTDLP
jgi:apolipoprotein N-acyltransferase